MCGIIGQWNRGRPIEEAVFSQMRDTLTHRGPDGAGNYFSTDRSVALGHRRLSFLDLSEAGTQPMTNADRSLWLTFNGEIYNFRHVRTELEGKGYIFRSNSDSEVILLGYQEWGAEVLQKLKGMFAFAVWDERKRKMFLARDRFGIKPLYYLPGKNSFLFASEIKGLLNNDFVKVNLDYSSVSDYLVYRYVPSPKTIWQEVRKLPPAHYLEFDWDKGVTVKRYWDIPFAESKSSLDEMVSRVDELLENSVGQHKISDVPVGIFLSGGYDSSAVAYFLNRIQYKHQAFTIGFENWPESEHQYAKMVADLYDVPLQEIILGAESLDLVEKLAYTYDEPIADISIVPTYSVSSLAAQNVKAVMSGEGADELFAGYHWQKFYKNKSKRPFWNLTFKATNTLLPKSKSLGVYVYADGMSMGMFDRKVLKETLHPDLHTAIPADTKWFYASKFRRGLSPLKQFQYMDVNCFMAELVLTKVDRASMANSLEVRVPFLDHELYEYFFRQRENTYYNEHTTKLVLNRILTPHLPKEIMDRPKQGFVGPDSYYMDINWYREVLSGGKLVQNQVINTKQLNYYFEQKEHWRLWKLAVLEFWFQRWT